MGIVAKQSARNTVALSTGFLLGAINTTYVLPAAFEGFEEGWGLLRILTAWGTILAQILALGTPNGILRFLPKAETPEREASMLGALCTIPAVLFAAVGVAFSLLGQDWLVSLDADSGYLLQDRMAAFLFMAGAYLALLLLKSALTHRMRTVTVTVVQEVWLKGSYLALAVVYLQGWMPFDTFFRWFLYTYAAAVAMLLLEAWSVKLRPAQPQFRKDIKPFLEYGLYALWNDGSRVIAKNLDVVMVGALLGLAVVPKYTFAFFIATVVALPLRAMTPILRALTSKAVSELGPEQSQGELQQAARVQLIATSTLLTAIWAGMPALDLALPEAYRGLQWVILAVGLSYVAQSAGGTAGAILQFSNRFRWAMPVNLGFVLMTVVTNLFFIKGLNMGVEGAALATALTALLNFGVRTTLMWRLFRIHPFSGGWWVVAGLAATVGLAASFLSVPTEALGWGKVWNVAHAVVRGGLAGGLVLGTSWALGALPELTTEMQKRLSKN
ncbi:MAG: lipopolysaccharide biosynthesis protein [Bacteroidota bacterium]|nr:lipopolysaccharide biosynthesis protein [Bacteroidota bacterium]